MAASMDEERAQLTAIINHWNSIQSDLFAITLPDENLEFFGVMKFCYKEGNDHIATKCIRVACTATTQLVIKALIEKFRPDMRMLLGATSYALYEFRDNVERLLDVGERPLLVQLNWVSKGHHGNGSDGTFIFRRNLGIDTRNKANKKLSKTEKKELKAIAKREKRERKERKKLTKKLKGSNKSLHDLDHTDNEDTSPSRAPSRTSSLWGEDNRLVRSLSNPEAVLRRRRHQKNSRSRESTPANEPIRVYSDAITNDNTCHTVLVSNNDTCDDVIGDLLNQFGLTRDSPSDYRLIVVSLFGENRSPNGQMLAPGDCPLLSHDGEGLVYHLRHVRDIPQSHANGVLCPLLVEVWSTEDDNRRRQLRRIALSTESTEIGSGRGSNSATKFVCLTDRGIRPRHCVLSVIRGRYTISPLDKHAETFVNGEMIVEPTFISHGAVVAFGRHCSFRFVDPVSQSAAAAATMVTGNGNLASSELSRHSTGNLLREGSYYSQDMPSLSNASRALSQPLDTFPNSVPSPVVMATTRANTLNRISANHDHRASDMLYRRSQSVQPNFVPVHSDDGGGDDDDDGNHRQQKLRSSKDSSILSSEFSDIDYLLLPATLSFHPTQEGALLTGLISDINCDDVKFKLSPAFALYFIAKHHLSQQYQPGLQGGERKKHLLVMMKNSISLIKRAVKGRDSANLLAFWMANVSELLQFFKRDSDLAFLSGDYESPLVKLIQQCFKHFCQCVLRELCLWLPALLDPSPDADSEDAYVSHDDESCDMEPDIIHIGRSAQQQYTTYPTIGRILMTLSSTMSLLKHHHVNPGLNIQIFSILFRAICVTVFNQVVGTPGYCHQAWGIRLRERLARIESWAERQGLERTTSSQLSLIVRAAELLQCPEAMVNGTTHKEEVLNSVQIHTLLSHYYSDTGPLPRGLIDKLVAMAKGTVDVRILAEGRRIILQEEISFNYLSDFRLPNCGYSCEGHRDIPSGFLDYLQPFIDVGLCDFTMNGDWRRTGSAHSMRAISAPSPISLTSSVSTIDNGSRNHHRSNTESDHMSKPDTMDTPKIMCITVSKVKQSLGISIGGGRSHRGNLGIFVWSITEGGAIHRDGRLEVGDQLLRVDDHSLMNCSQNEAVRILQETGNTFTLTVAKHAADFYGISYNIPSTKVSSLERQGDHHGDHQSAKSSFALKAERRRRREEQMKHHQGGSSTTSVGRKDSGMTLSIQKVSSLDESTASSCQSPVTTSNPQLTRWLMDQKRLQAERLSNHSSSRPTKLDAASDRESPMCYHDDSEDSSLCNSYTSGSRSYREGMKAQLDRDTPPELLRHDSNGLASWKRHKSIDESNHDNSSYDAPKYEQEPSQDFPDHCGNQVNLSMDVQPSQLTNNSLPSSAAVLEGSMLTSRNVRSGSGKMKQIMEHESSSPVMVDEPLKKEYHRQGSKEATLKLEAKSSRDTVQTNMKADLQMVMQLQEQLQQQQQQQQQHVPSRATGSQSDSDTVIDSNGSQEDARKYKLHQLIIELEEKKQELEKLEQEKANEEHRLAIEEQKYTEQEIKDEQTALRLGQQMSVEISRKRRRRELQKKRDEASERIQLLEFDKHRVKTKMLVLEKNVEELKAIIEQDQKMVIHERTGSHDQRMMYDRTGSHGHRVEYQRMGSHDSRMGSHDQRMMYERTGSHVQYQRMGSHDGRHSRPSSAQTPNKEVSHELPPMSPRYHHGSSYMPSSSPRLRASPLMIPITSESTVMSRNTVITTRASPINQNMGRSSVRNTTGSPFSEADNNLTHKKSRSRDLEEITSLSNKSVSETPSPYPISMVTRDHVDDHHNKAYEASSSSVVRKDSVRNKPKSLFMSTTTLNDQPQQSQRSNPPVKTKPTSYRNSRPHNNTIDANSLANLEKTMKSPVSNNTTPTTPTLLRQHESTGGGQHYYSKSEVVSSASGGSSNQHSYARMDQDPQQLEMATERPLMSHQWSSNSKSHNYHGNQTSRNVRSPNSHHNHDYQPDEESSDETCPRRDVGDSPAAPDVIQSTFTSTSYISSGSPDGVGTSASPSPELPADHLYSPGAPPITSLTLTCSQQDSPPRTPPPFQRETSPLVKPADHRFPWIHNQPVAYKQQRALSPQQRMVWDHQTHPTRLVTKDITQHPGRLHLPSSRRTPVHMYPGTDL